MDDVNHYQRLGIAVDAQPDAIRAAYRRRARSAHPDSTGSIDNDEMTAINEAWYVLRDPQRRRSYDAVIGAALSTDADESLESQVRRSARTLVGMLRAAIVLAVAAGAMFLLIALLEGH
ncbi:MAG: J domain-containing protein [Ilumatobacteraceae bacterium]